MSRIWNNPWILGLTFKIHNGKSYTEVDVTEEMVGHKFGESLLELSSL
jgi:ribosomal protein S19